MPSHQGVTRCLAQETAHAHTSGCDNPRLPSRDGQTYGQVYGVGAAGSSAMAATLELTPPVPPKSFEDGIEFRVATVSDLDAAGALFNRIWLVQNILYSTAGVTPEELGRYTAILIDRARAHPWTCVVGVDTIADKAVTSADVPLVRDGALVAVHFQSDLLARRGDYAGEAARLGALSPRVRAIHAFSHNMLAPLWEHPAFELLRQPGAVAESLHAGVAESYGGRFILPRLGAYVFGLYYTLGFVVHVGVATSPVTSKFYSAAAETLPGARRGLRAVDSRARLVH